MRYYDYEYNYHELANDAYFLEEDGCWVSEDDSTDESDNYYIVDEIEE